MAFNDTVNHTGSPREDSQTENSLLHQFKTQVIKSQVSLLQRQKTTIHLFINAWSVNKLISTPFLGICLYSVLSASLSCPFYLPVCLICFVCCLVCFVCLSVLSASLSCLFCLPVCFICLCVLSACLVCLFCLPVCFVCLPVCLVGFVCLSVLSASLSFCFVCQSVLSVSPALLQSDASCLSACLLTRQSVCPSVCLPVSLSARRCQNSLMWFVSVVVSFYSQASEPARLLS